MLKALFGKKKPSPDEPKPLSSSLISSILECLGAKSIPPMPGAAQKAFQLSVDPSAEARDFVEVIESDEALSARVLKIANSVFFDRGHPTKTIEEAVIVIGMNELRCLLNATTLSEIFPSKHPARTQLWANDVATALISRALTQRIAPNKAEVAFLGGLMHDIGKLLLLQRATEQYGVVLKRAGELGSFVAAETETFVFDHMQVGQLIAERWKFTPDLIDIIAGHHHPLPEPGTIPPTLATIVQCADTIAHALGLGHGSGFHRVRTQAEGQLANVCATVGIAPSEQKEALNRFRIMFETEYDLYVPKSS